MSCCRDNMYIPTKLSGHAAVQPSRAYEFDAGADLVYSGEESVSIGPGERKLLSTGVSVAIPEGFVGLIWPRSGNAVKKGFDTMAGVIDSQYRGEIKVLIINHDTEVQTVNCGDKIAQLIVQKCYNFPFVAVNELPESRRGESGFGSSGA